MTTQTITIIEFLRTDAALAHEIFFASDRNDLNHPPILENTDGFDDFCFFSVSDLISFSAISVLLPKLLRFLMQGMLAAETAVFIEFKSVRVILFVLHSVVVALFALTAGKSYLYSHNFRHLLIDLGNPIDLCRHNSTGNLCTSLAGRAAQRTARGCKKRTLPRGMSIISRTVLPVKYKSQIDINLM